MNWYDDFNDVKVGDRVALPVSSGDVRFLTVERVTQTLFVADGTRFRKKDGGEVGAEQWSRCHARKITDEIMERKARFDRSVTDRKLIREIKRTATDLHYYAGSVDSDKVAQAHALLTEALAQLTG